MSESNNNRTALLVVLLLLVGAGLGYTLFKNKQIKTEYEQLVVENTEVERLYAELDAEYERSLAQLEELEGENASLDSLVEAKKTELNEAKAYIARLISDKNASAGELANARKLIKQLTDQRVALESTVDSLRQLNIALEADNMTLLQENEVIQASLDNVSREASELKDENQELKENINRASILSTRNMTAEGIRVKNNGKEVSVSRASNVNKLKLCFELPENKIAPEGPTQLLVRIIGPDGVTLTLQAMGSGNFTNAETGEPMQYTYEIAPDYSREGKTVCSFWDQNSGFAAGTYQVEVYQQGVRIGQTGLELR